MSTVDLQASTRSYKSFLTSQDIPMQTRTDTPVQSSQVPLVAVDIGELISVYMGYLRVCGESWLTIKDL